MPAIASRRSPALPAAPPAQRALRVVPAPARRRRRPSAAALAVYALGLTVGFLLAAIATAPGGAASALGQVQLAGVAAVVAVLAALRSRAVARRRRPGARRVALERS
jgi:hypothetical protein